MIHRQAIPLCSLANRFGVRSVVNTEGLLLLFADEGEELDNAQVGIPVYDPRQARAPASITGISRLSANVRSTMYRGLRALPEGDPSNALIVLDASGSGH